jgi:hypothetical protein
LRSDIEIDSNKTPREKELAPMRRPGFTGFLVVVLVAGTMMATAQQLFRLPDKSTLKHLTTKQVDRPPDIQGKQITLDYYSAPNGDVVSIYSFRGKYFAFSTHSNSDPQKTYRMFMDMNGSGTFQQINPSVHWQVPAWAKTW